MDSWFLGFLLVLILLQLNRIADWLDPPAASWR